MNVTVQVGRVCFDPIYFPPKGENWATLFFLLEVSTFSRNGKRVIDYFNVQYTGNHAETVARKLRRAQFVCVRGAVHLDKERVCMRIRADQPGGVEVYTRLPPAPPGINAPPGLFSSDVGDRFLQSVEACQLGDYLVLGSPVRVVRGKRLRKSSSGDHPEEIDLPENLPEWMKSMNEILATSNPFDAPDTPILPDFAAYISSLDRERKAALEGAESPHSAPQERPGESGGESDGENDPQPEETDAPGASPPRQSVPLTSAIPQRLTSSNPFPSPASAVSAAQVSGAIRALHRATTQEPDAHPDTMP